MVPSPSSGTIDNSIVARQSLLLRDSPLNLQAIEDGRVPRSLPLVWRGYLLVVYGPREKSCQCGREKLGTLMIEMKFIGLVIPDGESGWINRYQRVHAGSLCGHRHLTDGIHGRRSRRDKKDQLGPLGLTYSRRRKSRESAIVSNCSGRGMEGCGFRSKTSSL